MSVVFDCPDDYVNTDYSANGMGPCQYTQDFYWGCETDYSANGMGPCQY
jgi:hypothetical protein